MRARWYWLAELILVVLVASGCGSGDRPAVTGTVPFSGTVKLDGQPLPNATVQFIPTSGTDAVDAGGQTDETGKFEVKSDGGRADGAKPGEYKVVISRLVKPDGSVAVLTPEKSPMQLMMEENAKESVPPKYSDVFKTTLKATVPASGGTQDFDLKK